MFYTINNFKTADDTLIVNDLLKVLFDAVPVLMDELLLNLHGKENQIRRKVDSEKSCPDALVFKWTVTLHDSWVKLEQA
jgi:hypothetical protein